MFNGESGAGNFLPIILMGAVVVAFYFFAIRPQKKQEKETAKMRNELEVGDEVVTIGGIIGQVVSVKNETVTIVTSKDRTKLRFVKSAIKEVTYKVNAPAEKAAPAAPTPVKADDKKVKKVKEKKAKKSVAEESPIETEAKPAAVAEETTVEEPAVSAVEETPALEETPILEEAPAEEATEEKTSEEAE